MLKKLISKIKADYRKFITARKKTKKLEEKIKKYENILAKHFNPFTAHKSWGMLGKTKHFKINVEGVWIEDKNGEFTYNPDLKIRK